MADEADLYRCAGFAPEELRQSTVECGQPRAEYEARVVEGEPMEIVRA